MAQSQGYFKRIGYQPVDGLDREEIDDKVIELVGAKLATDNANGYSDVTLDVSSDLLRKQVTLIGSWTFSIVGLMECARFVADRNIAVDKVFTNTWRLDQAEEAYNLWDQQTSEKGVSVM